MKEKTLVFTCKYHLGDNPGIFQDAVYVGQSLELPLHLLWMDEKTPTVNLWVSTRHIETWGEGKGHAVTINGEVVGHLKDKDDHMGENELSRISIPITTFRDTVAKDKSRFTLGIRVESKAIEQGRTDDFIFSRLESEHAVFRLGW